MIFAHGSREVLQHGQVPFAGLWVYLWDRGQFGVDLFFIISGFILVYISRQRIGTPGYAQQFLIRRIARVVPVYWFFTTLLVIIAIFIPQVQNHSDTDTLYVFASYFFVPFARPSNGAIEPLLGLGWSLNYEMYFYLLFFAAMVLFKARALWAVLGYFIAVFIIGRLLQPESVVMGVWTGSLVLEFGYGMLIAFAFGKQFYFNRSTTIILLATGVLLWLVISLDPRALNMLALDHRYRGFFWGVPAALIVASLILGRLAPPTRVGGRCLVTLGGASYSLYLVHLFVMRLLTLVLRPVDSGLGDAYCRGLFRSLR